MPLFEQTSGGLAAAPPTSFEAKGVRHADLRRLLACQIAVLSEDRVLLAEAFGECEDSKGRTSFASIATSGSS